MKNKSLMEESIFGKNKIVIMIIAIMLVVISVIGVTYAYYVVTDSTNDSSLIHAADFDVVFESGSNEIDLSNSYPMPDSYAMQQSAYTFSVENNGELESCYTVQLVDGDSNTLTRSQLRYAINSNVPNNLPASGTLLYEGHLTVGQKDNHSFRLWINESETLATAANKSYSGVIRVTSSVCEEQ